MTVRHFCDYLAGPEGPLEVWDGISEGCTTTAPHLSQFSQFSRIGPEIACARLRERVSSLLRLISGFRSGGCKNGPSQGSKDALPSRRTVLGSSIQTSAPASA